MTKNYHKLREFLIHELNDITLQGYRVFINNEDQFQDYNYGIITDGKDILYVECCRNEPLIETALPYIKSKENGSMCPAIEDGVGYTHLSEDAFLESVKYGKKLAAKYHVTFYADFDDYVKRNSFEMKNYIEL